MIFIKGTEIFSRFSEDKLSGQDTAFAETKTEEKAMRYYNMKEVGKRIQKIRKEKEMTQEEFSKQIHITVSALSKIERGTKGISIDLAVEIAGFSGVSLDHLILGRETKNDLLKKRLYEMMMELEDAEEQ